MSKVADTLTGERHEQLVDGQRAGVAGVHGALEVVDEDPRGDRLIRGVLDGEQWSHEPVSSCLVWSVLPWREPVRTTRRPAAGRVGPTASGRVMYVSCNGLSSVLGVIPPRSSGADSGTRFGVLPGFVRVSAREQRIASSALLPTPSGLSMFPPAPGPGDVFALGVPTEASAGE